MGLSNRVQVMSLRDARLLDMEYVEKGQTKHRLVLQVGTTAGERSFFSFPEKLGTNLEIWPLSDTLAAQVADQLDENGA